MRASDGSCPGSYAILYERTGRHPPRYFKLRDGAVGWRAARRVRVCVVRASSGPRQHRHLGRRVGITQNDRPNPPPTELVTTHLRRTWMGSVRNLTHTLLVSCVLAAYKRFTHIVRTLPRRVNLTGCIQRILELNPSIETGSPFYYDQARVREPRRCWWWVPRYHRSNRVEESTGIGSQVATQKLGTQGTRRQP